MRLALNPPTSPGHPERLVFLQDMQTKLFYGTEARWVKERSQAMVLQSFAAAYDFSRQQKLQNLQAVIVCEPGPKQLILPLR